MFGKNNIFFPISEFLNNIYFRFITILIFSDNITKIKHKNIKYGHNIIIIKNHTGNPIISINKYNIIIFKLFLIFLYKSFLYISYKKINDINFI